MRIVAFYGEAITAGYTIGIRIMVFTFLPSWGMANAASTLVGQHLGAGQPEEAEKSVWMVGRLTMFTMTFLGIVVFALAPTLVGWFDSNPEVVAPGALALRIMVLGFPFYAYEMVLGQGFNGAGDTYTPTLLNFICFILVEIPLAYVLAYKAGLKSDGVYWSVFLAETLLAVLLYWQFSRGRWKQTKV
jgi:Na+-driven multidrug efflux pump